VTMLISLLMLPNLWIRTEVMRILVT
jgi:hypothetical protein